jgi:hypothetical protein
LAFPKALGKNLGDFYISIIGCQIPPDGFSHQFQLVPFAPGLFDSTGVSPDTPGMPSFAAGANMYGIKIVI